MVPTCSGHRQKESVSGFISGSRILSPNWIVQAGVSYTQKSGHLSDPYKANDKRPDERNLYTFNAGSRYWINQLKPRCMQITATIAMTGASNLTPLSLALYQNWQKLQIIPSALLHPNIGVVLFYFRSRYDPV